VAVVGIDRYRAWPTLDNAVNDANGALAVFQRLGFEQIVAPLIDGAATADAIRRLVTDDLATLGSDDSLVLFFAGHGHTRTRTLQSGPVETGFLIPVDGDRADGHAATWLRLDTWLSDVARLPARHILVILDACHSGIALGSVIKWRSSTAGRDGSLDELRRRQSRRVITSALGDQRAMDSGPVHGHSLFTGCLIEALTGGLARDGHREATGSELGIYVQRRVTSYTGSQQTPDFGTLELDHRGELIVPLASSPDPKVTAPARLPEPGRDAPSQPHEPGRRALVASIAAPTVPDVTGAVKLPAPGRRAAPRKPGVTPVPLLVRALIWFLVFCCIGVPFGQLEIYTGAGILSLIMSGALVIAIAAGRWVSDIPPVFRWLSAKLLRRKLWTATAIAATVTGTALGMTERARLEKVCREELIEPDAVLKASGNGVRGIAITAAKACRSIGRDDEARAREAEASQTAPATSGLPDEQRTTLPTAEAKAIEAPHKQAEQASAFAAALAEAQRQPETPEGAEAAVASYRRAMEAGTLDKAQLVQFALILRAYGHALLAKHDYAGAICAFEEAKIRDPGIDVVTALASARAAEHPHDQSPHGPKGLPDGGSAGGDPDALEPFTRIDPETGKVYPEYRNRRGCRVPREGRW
jgi:hypothetical protein